MEFHSRGFQPTPSREIPKQPRKQIQDIDFEPTPTAAGPTGPQKPRRPFRLPRPSLKVVVAAALIVLAVGVVFLVTNRKDPEVAFIDTGTYQAVSVQEDSYFGKITEVNSRFIVLRDIFYISTTTDEDGEENSQLIKRGCEAWQPLDKMVIYRSDVRFWENISTDGAVGKLISQWKTQNPNGQTCNTTNSSVTEQSSRAPATSGTATSPSTTQSQGTTPSGATTPSTNTNQLQD